VSKLKECREKKEGGGGVKRETEKERDGKREKRRE